MLRLTPLLLALALALGWFIGSGSYGAENPAVPSKNALLPRVVSVEAQLKYAITTRSFDAEIQKSEDGCVATLTLQQSEAAQIAEAIPPTITISDLIDPQTMKPIEITGKPVHRKELPNMTVRFTIKLPDNLTPLIENKMKARAAFPIRSAEQVSIPKDTIQHSRKGSPYVYVIAKKQGRTFVSRRFVQIQSEDSLLVFIRSGLEPGERVVRFFNEPLRDNLDVIELN